VIGLKKLENGFDFFINLFAWIAKVMVIIITILIILEIILRYFFNNSLKFVPELSNLSLIFITFLGSALILKRDQHAKLDLIASYLKPRTMAAVNLVTYAVCSIVSLVLAWYTGALVVDYFKQGIAFYDVIPFPKWTVFAVMPFGFLLLCIQFLRSAFGYARARVAGQQPAAERS
jgi:C4-dicarboxylate transporter, DctQ subunit